MLKKLRLLLLAPLCLACQSNEPASEFKTDPDLAAYNDEAPLTKKLLCWDDDCKSPYGEENYIYNSDGKLTKMEYFGMTTSGKMEPLSYTEYTYGQDGLLIRKKLYNKDGAASAWVVGNESEYEYTNGVLSLEKTYFYQYNQAQKVPTGQISYQFKDGKKQVQKWYDDKNVLYQQLVYSYKNHVLNRETWYDGKDNIVRIFEHKFSGNRRQIGEYLLNSKEQLALIEKVYDEQGRLTTQRTKVANMLLCAMTPGLIRYSY